MSPVSWIGKNPFGMITNRYPESATVAKNTVSVIR